MLELINSPLYDHGYQPELEVTEPAIERMLGNVLWELRPDVVHANTRCGCEADEPPRARDDPHLRRSDLGERCLTDQRPSRRLARTVVY